MTMYFFQIMPMRKSRSFKKDKSFTPCQENIGDEIFPNGSFRFNITRILEDIHSGKLEVELEKIDVNKWFKRHCKGHINEKHLLSVSLSKPVLQAEISPGNFVIIDGNHRMEKALQEEVPFVDSWKLRGEQLIPYFTEEKGYKAFISYWNGKVEEGGDWSKE
jgi:hypothetical protein